MLPAYVKLLCDNEAEVRTAAEGKVTKFCQSLEPKRAIQHILPCVKVQKYYGPCLPILYKKIFHFLHQDIHLISVFRTYQLILLSMFAPLWHQLSWEWHQSWER